MNNSIKKSYKETRNDSRVMRTEGGDQRQTQRFSHPHSNETRLDITYTCTHTPRRTVVKSQWLVVFIYIFFFFSLREKSLSVSGL